MDDDVVCCHRISEVLDRREENVRIKKNIAGHLTLALLTSTKLLKIYKPRDFAFFLSEPTVLPQDFIRKKFFGTRFEKFLLTPKFRSYDRGGNLVEEFEFRTPYKIYSNFAIDEQSYLSDNERKRLVTGVKDFLFACLEEKVIPMDLTIENFVLEGEKIFFLSDHRLHGFNWAVNEEGRRSNFAPPYKRKKFKPDVKRQYNGGTISILRGNQQEWETCSNNLSSARSLLTAFIDLLFILVKYKTNGNLIAPLKHSSVVKVCGENCMLYMLNSTDSLSKEIHNSLCGDLFNKLKEYGNQNQNLFKNFPDFSRIAENVDRFLNEL